jgi:hypothetical protein
MPNIKGHEDSIKNSRFKAAWHSGPTRTIRVRSLWPTLLSNMSVSLLSRTNFKPWVKVWDYPNKALAVSRLEV